MKLAEKLKGITLIGAIDCDNDKNKLLCAKYEITTFPTIKVFFKFKTDCL